ncbi:MAG: hypothetical protein Q8Q11_03720 [bacterium]|nr:hypothetical protein [bacterium]MDZ4248111.1 hypothetical protein [Patescibacteria group bacterium]
MSAETRTAGQQMAVELMAARAVEAYEEVTNRYGVEFPEEDREALKTLIGSMPESTLEELSRRIDDGENPLKVLRDSEIAKLEVTLKGK